MPGPWDRQILVLGSHPFYAWLTAGPARAAREAADAVLVGQIRAMHEADPAYGAPRVAAELNDGCSAR